MLSLLIVAASVVSVSWAQESTAAPTTAAGLVATTTTAAADAATTAVAGATTAAAGGATNPKTVDQWLAYYTEVAKAYKAAKAPTVADDPSSGTGDCGGSWSNVTSQLTKISIDGPTSGFDSGKTNAFCYGLYYSCAATVKNLTIGDNVYPPNLFVYDENGNQKQKPPQWDAYATGMCWCKKPLLICFEALNCYPDNTAAKYRFCGRIKNECNRGECPSRGVFCDLNDACDWDDKQISEFTDIQKASILAQRVVSPASRLALAASLAVLAAVLAL